MCGIAGIISAASSALQGDRHITLQIRLKAMTDAISHRGPDGEGIWINTDGRAGFGHRRLSIIDLSAAAAQPMHYPFSTGSDITSRYTIIHNGEIYNYRELRDELSREKYVFRTQSDTEVMLAAYDYWQEDCLDQFEGMFAFAIWDEQEKEFFAARDRFGEKPFFYHYDGSGLVFGSEMKAIWAAGVSKTPNLKMLFNFITLGYVDNPGKPGEVFFENIHKLPPASFLKYRPGKEEPVIEKYWDLDPSLQDKKTDEAAAIEKFNSLLKESINKRLRSDVLTGTSLSGGLDSSSIAAISHELKASNQSHKSFTAIFPGFEKDESLFADQVARSLGLASYTVPVSAEGLARDWDQLVYHQEEPFSSASIYAQYKVFELAHQNGVKVLLDGQGADETLAGYHQYYKWYWQELFHQRKLFRSGEIKAARKNGVNEGFGPRNIVASLFPDLATVVLERQYLVKALRQDDLNRDFVKGQSKDAYYSRPAHFNLNGALFFNTFVHGLEELLRYADRNSMAHGRECRLPFLDHSLVEFVFSLPSHFKIRQGWTKWILRETMKGRLPDTIAWRKEKIGFEPPQQEWMNHKDIRERVQEARRKLIQHSILAPSALAKPVRALSSHAPDNFDWRYLAAAPFI
ncbi:MAG TPA: asparagine synthase (glutamine-hydrolyzing) [Chitinophagaceae bacterium]|nr:asparagine synthase (glutamine-hydrolyzing) [Chitinophagaceae bacterium]